MKNFFLIFLVFILCLSVAYLFFKQSDEDFDIQEEQTYISEQNKPGVCSIWGEEPQITSEECERLGGQVIAAMGECCDKEEFLGTVTSFRSPNICCKYDL